MRRIVATLLVVASPLLLAQPVSATEERAAPLSAPPSAVPALAPEAAAPVAAPAVAPVVAAPAVTAPAAPKPVRQAAKAVRAKAPSMAELSDAAYAAKLQADLCHARQIFCGLGRNGRYPGS